MTVISVISLSIFSSSPRYSAVLRGEGSNNLIVNGERPLQTRNLESDAIE